MRLGTLDCADRATLVEALAGGKAGVVIDVGKGIHEPYGTQYRSTVGI